MLRIVFISIFKEGDGGGNGRVAFEMARFFSKYYDVCMICPGEETRLHIDQTGFKTFTIRSSGENKLYAPLLTKTNIDKVFSFLQEYNPNVIHTHDPALLGVVGQLYARIKNIPLVYTAHVLPMSILEFGTSEFIKVSNFAFAESLMERYLFNFYENCNAVIALNNIAAQNIRAFGYKGKILNIPNGRNLSHYNHCNFAKVTEQEHILTFVGYISHRKNQLFLVEMMRFLPKRYKLWLIGEPLNQEYYQQLLQSLHSNNLEDRVVFLGQVNAAEIPKYLEKTHVFVSASRLEVQSLAVIEAMASGTPIVGISNETIDELVDQTIGCRVEKDADPQALADAVRSVCELPQDKYDQLCANARDRVKDLDWFNIMQVTTIAYQSLMDQTSPIQKRVFDVKKLSRIISYLPEGQVKDSLENIISHAVAASDTHIGYLRPRRPPVSPGLRLIAEVTIITSVILYYFLNGPLKLWKRFRK